MHDADFKIPNHSQEYYLQIFKESGVMRLGFPFKREISADWILGLFKCGKFTVLMTFWMGFKHKLVRREKLLQIGYMELRQQTTLKVRSPGTIF